MAKLGSFYVNQSGSKYKLVYVTPSSNAVPTVDQWAFLVLERRAFLDVFPQRFVSIPVVQLDRFFLGAERGPDVESPV